MLVVQPNERNGLPTLLENLTSNVDEFLRVLDGKNFREEEVYLGLPAFSVDGDTIQLKDTLTAMGLVSIFTAGLADLSGMDGEGRLFVSRVLHKALIDVSLCNKSSLSIKSLGFEARKCCDFSLSCLSIFFM